MKRFHSGVYRLVERIPRGQVATYGQIAALLGYPRAARAVGRAMKHVPGHLPWHRVVNAQGGISLRRNVGSMLTQLGRHKGNTVIALASTDEKLEYCKAMGADHTINYRTTDYVEAVKKLTDNQGVDVVFNSVGGDSLKTDPKIIKRLTGRWVILGRSAGLGTIDPYSFIYDSITVRSCSVLTLRGTEDEKASRRFLDEWLRTEKLIEPAHVYKLADINAAFDLLEHQRSHGKIVLVP